MTHATDWCAAHGPRPCACWADGEVALLDLDRLPPTVPPSVPATLDGGLEVVTPALRPGLL